MRKRDKLFILKYFLNIFNGIFMALGLMLVGFGLWISIENNTFFTLLLSTGEHSLIAPVSHMLLATGSIIVFIGLLGYLGSHQEIRCLVVMYKGLLILALILQVAMLVLLYTGKDMIYNLWKGQMAELISNYGNKNLPEKEHQWDILNDIQHMTEVAAISCCVQEKQRDQNGPLNGPRVLRLSKEEVMRDKCAGREATVSKCDVPLCDDSLRVVPDERLPALPSKRAVRNISGCGMKKILGYYFQLMLDCCQ